MFHLFCELRIYVSYYVLIAAAAWSNCRLDIYNSCQIIEAELTLFKLPYTLECLTSSQVSVCPQAACINLSFKSDIQLIFLQNPY